MRLGRLEIRRARAADDPALTPHREAGASGTINQDGWIVSSEYNPDLRWPDSITIYDRMVKSDSSVREAYLHTVAPILNAEWDIEPASDDPAHLEHAAMVKAAYFEWASVPFSVTLAQTLKYLAQGYQVFEIVDKVIDAELAVARPDEDDLVLPSRQFLTWDRWAHRKPETVWRWNVEEGRLVSIEQRTFKDGDWGQFTILVENGPVAGLAVFVNEQEGDDFTGLSMLRSAYKAWWMKELIEKVATQAYERHGIGVLVAYVPDDAKNDTKLLDTISTMLEDVKAGDNSYLVFPGPKGMTTAQSTGGFWFEIASPTGGIPDFTPFLEYQRGEIKGNVLARFAELGHGSTGARATSDTQSQVWYAALHAVADHIVGVHNQQIRRLVEANYGPVDKAPSLVARNIEHRNLEEFAQANAQLVAAGAIEPDKSYRGYIREGVDAPPEDEGTDEMVQKRDSLALEPPTEPLNKPTPTPEPGG